MMGSGGGDSKIYFVGVVIRDIMYWIEWFMCWIGGNYNV